MTPAIRAPTRAMWVGLASVVLASVFAIGHLVRNEMDPTVFIAIGEEDQRIREYAEQLLGEVVLRPQLGHDGRFFFVQGNDPWLLAPEDHATVLDRPVYRSQRMAYPVLASGGGLLDPQAVVWGMLVVNLIAMGVGGYFCARLALRFGGSVWWGLAFPLNIGLISEFSIGGAGIVAAAASFGAIYMILEERLLMASVLLTLSCLAREVMLVAVVGVAIWMILQRRRRDAVNLILLPVAAVASWGLYIRTVLPTGGAVAEGNIGLPFVGFVGNLSNWLSDPTEFLIGAVVVVVLVFYVFRAWRTPSLTSWAFLPFAGFAFLLAEPVWDGYFNITRAVAPVLTAYILIAFAPSPDFQRQLEEQRPQLLARLGA